MAFLYVYASFKMILHLSTTYLYMSKQDRVISLSMSLITRTLYYPLKLSLEFYICDAATEKRKYDNIHVLPNGLLNFVAYQREERCEGRKQRKTKFRIVKVKWAVTQNIMHQKREEGEKIRGIFFGFTFTESFNNQSWCRYT